MGDEEPGAASGFFVGVGGGGRGLREDGDAAGAGAGGEVGRVDIDGVEKWHYMVVDCTFRRLVRLR